MFKGISGCQLCLFEMPPLCLVITTDERPTDFKCIPNEFRTPSRILHRIYGHPATELYQVNIEVTVCICNVEVDCGATFTNLCQNFRLLKSIGRLVSESDS